MSTTVVKSGNPVPKIQHMTPAMWGNIILLALGFCFGYGSLFIHVGSTNVAVKQWGGSELAPVTFGVFFATWTLTTVPSSLLQQRFGRKPVMIAIGFTAVAGAAMNVGATFIDANNTSARLATMLVGVAIQGMNQPQVNFLRFTAVDVSTPQARPVAMSLVIGGAVIAAVAVPRISIATRTVEGMPEYATSYIVLMCLYVMYILILAVTNFTPLNERTYAPMVDAEELDEKEMKVVSASRWATPQPVEEETPVDPRLLQIKKQLALPIGQTVWEHTEPRPLGVISRQPAFALPLIGCVVAYSTMVWLMIMCSSSMLDVGLTFDDSVNAIMAHMLGMFLPSFITGSLIRKFGADVIAVIGGGVLLLGSLLFFISLTLPVYVAGIFLVGLGWNFNFIACSSLVTGSYIGPEKFKTQGLFDVCVFGVVTVIMVVAGYIFEAMGPTQTGKWWGTVGINVGIQTIQLGAIIANMVRLRKARAALVKEMELLIK